MLTMGARAVAWVVSVMLVGAGSAGAAPAPVGASGAKAPGDATVATAASTARGVVKSVSGARLVLDAPKGSGPESLVVDERTVFERLGKTLTVKDLKAGDPVTVSYTMKDGKAIATRVWVRSPAK
jgi:hypothetical protein